MDVEKGLPPPIPFSSMLELEVDVEAGDPVVAVVKVTKLASVPVYAVGVSVCITRLSSLVLEADELEAVDFGSPVELGESVAVVTFVFSNALVEEIVLWVIISFVAKVEVRVVSVLLSLNCPLASWLTEDCGEDCVVAVDCNVMDDVEVDCWIIVVVEEVRTDWTASVVDSEDETLFQGCSVGVGASSVEEGAAVVVPAEEMLGVIDVETVSVDTTMIVVASADGMVCAIGVAATCMLVSIDVVGCTRLDVPWIRFVAVARMLIAAATAS